MSCSIGKIYLLSPLMDDDSYRTYQASEHKFNPAQKFYSLMLQGLIENGADVCCYSFINHEKAKYAKNNNRFKYFAYDKKGKRNSVATKMAIDLSSNIDPKCDIIIADGESYWPLVAAFKCRKKTKVKIYELITDFPNHVISYNKNKKMKFSLAAILSWLYSMHKLNKMKKAKAFIVLTMQMMNIIGNSKPYIVVEGFSQAFEQTKNSNTKDDVLKIMYAGSLNNQSGIITFANYLIKNKKASFILSVYGDGICKNKIVELSKTDGRIQYCGVVPLCDIFNAEIEADILVNPRPSQETFNEYSFPSKTLEYMSSGTAVASTKLSGIPDEYWDYLILLNDTTEEAYLSSIKAMLGISKDNLRTIGKRSQEFVCTAKSCFIQAKRILDFLEMNDK